MNYSDMQSILSMMFDDNITVERKNCKKISERLYNFDIKHQNVFRHRLFDKDYYLIDISDDVCIRRKTIAKALSIPRHWIDLYDHHTYAILEDKINEKYCDSKGVLCFPDFNILKHWNKIDIEKELNNHRTSSDNQVSVYDDFILVLNSVCSAEIIADRLNIPYESVVDISLENTNIKHIIWKSKISKCC